MLVGLRADRGRHQVQVAVAHATLCHQGFGAFAHLLHRALQHGRFKALIMVQVHMQGRDKNVVWHGRSLACCLCR